jgi:hypothetical protein
MALPRLGRCLILQPCGVLRLGDRPDRLQSGVHLSVGQVIEFAWFATLLQLYEHATPLGQAVQGRILVSELDLDAAAAHGLNRGDCSAHMRRQISHALQPAVLVEQFSRVAEGDAAQLLRDRGNADITATPERQRSRVERGRGVLRGVAHAVQCDRLVGLRNRLPSRDPDRAVAVSHCHAAEAIQAQRARVQRRGRVLSRVPNAYMPTLWFDCVGTV